jgi:protein-L-isoaspartate(D-aspartate) O-methyltransferase
MSELHLLGDKHTSTTRDYQSRVCDPEIPKYIASGLAKKWAVDYWDGDRRTGYGGYRRIPGVWDGFLRKLVDHYGLTSKSRVLDIGCGKGFMIADLLELLPGVHVEGIDISDYAIERAPEQLNGLVQVANCIDLPFEDKSFDLAVSINVFHNLHCKELAKSLEEISRVASRQYLVVESYRNEREKQNLLYWQLTCEAFNSPEDWEWWLEASNYPGDWEFIFFN